jgi:hypothetical protein
MDYSHHARNIQVGKRTQDGDIERAIEIAEDWSP